MFSYLKSHLKCHFLLSQHDHANQTTKRLSKTSHPQQGLVEETNLITVVFHTPRLLLPLPEAEAVVVVMNSLFRLLWPKHTLLLMEEAQAQALVQAQ